MNFLEAAIGGALQTRLFLKILQYFIIQQCSTKSRYINILTKHNPIINTSKKDSTLKAVLKKRYHASIVAIIAIKGRIYLPFPFVRLLLKETVNEIQNQIHIKPFKTLTL